MSVIQQKLTTQEKTTFTLLFFLLIGLFIIGLNSPDPYSRIIRSELVKQGYDVENVDFKFVRNGDRFRERIYQSSVPIYYEGNYVSQWAVASYSYGLSFVSHKRVEPYSPLTE